MARPGFSVDGEEGFTLKASESHLLLRKADRHVRIPFNEITSADWRKRQRYGRTLLWMGIALLIAVGFGAVLLAIYYLPSYEALVITYDGKEYAVSGERARLEGLQARIRRDGTGVARSPE